MGESGKSTPSLHWPQAYLLIATCTLNIQGLGRDGRADRNRKSSAPWLLGIEGLKWYPVQENLLGIGLLPASTVLLDWARNHPHEARQTPLPTRGAKVLWAGAQPAGHAHPSGMGRSRRWACSCHFGAEDCGKLAEHSCLSDTLCKGRSCLCWVSWSQWGTVCNDPPILRSE